MATGKFKYLNLPKGYSKIKSPKFIRSRKEVEDYLNLAYDSTRIEKTKKEVLVCYA